MDEGAAHRVNMALGQTSKVPASAAPPKRVAKRAPPPPAPLPAPRRTRAVSAPTAKAAAPAAAGANNKLDCKQPFWIDEKGIRRLKMACL